MARPKTINSHGCWPCRQTHASPSAKPALVVTAIYRLLPYHPVLAPYPTSYGMSFISCLSSVARILRHFEQSISTPKKSPSHSNQCLCTSTGCTLLQMAQNVDLRDPHFSQTKCPSHMTHSPSVVVTRGLSLSGWTVSHFTQ